MFCNKCGSEIRAGSKFCPQCGNTIKKEAPNKSLIITLCVAAVIILFVFFVVIFGSSSSKVEIQQNQVDTVLPAETQDDELTAVDFVGMKVSKLIEMYGTDYKIGTYQGAYEITYPNFEQNYTFLVLNDGEDIKYKDIVTVAVWNGGKINNKISVGMSADEIAEALGKQIDLSENVMEGGYSTGFELDGCYVIISFDDSLISYSSDVKVIDAYHNDDGNNSSVSVEYGIDTIAKSLELKITNNGNAAVKNPKLKLSFDKMVVGILDSNWTGINHAHGLGWYEIECDNIGIIQANQEKYINLLLDDVMFFENRANIKVDFYSDNYSENDICNISISSSELDEEVWD